jgi:hypothetical protein
MSYNAQDVSVIERQCMKVLIDFNDVMLRNVREGMNQPNEKVRQYLHHGVGRRLNVMQLAIRKIYELFPPDQVEILPKETINEVQVYLQAFVINVAGIFDNWAWAFVLRHGLLDAVGGRRGVGMFLRSTQQCLPQSLNIYVTTDPIRNWYAVYMKDFRDALAHRIPLYVPPSRLDPSLMETYRAMGVRKEELYAAQDWDELQRVSDEQERLGKAYPVFLKDFERPAVPMHPQINGDGVTVLDFANNFYDAWHEFVQPPTEQT